MTSYATDTLDISRITVADVIPGLDYEVLRKSWVDAFVAYWDEMRAVDPTLPAYDMASLETDPAIVVGEASSYVRVLERAAFDDRARKLMLVSSYGPALDLIGNTYYGVERMAVRNDDGTLTYELDERYRTRLRLAPEAGLPRAKVRSRIGAAKTLGGYIFHTMTADIRVVTADAASLDRGNVTVAVYVEDGADADVVTSAVRTWLSREDVKGATDILVVKKADVMNVDVDATLVALNGPDESVLIKAARDSYNTMLLSRSPFRAPLFLKAIDASLQVAGVETTIRRSPSVDVLSPFGTVVRPGTVSLDVQRVGPSYG
jgi:phage-related baseplate assembly protein